MRARMRQHPFLLPCVAGEGDPEVVEGPVAESDRGARRVRVGCVLLIDPTPSSDRLRCSFRHPRAKTKPLRASVRGSPFSHREKDNA